MMMLTMYDTCTIGGSAWNRRKPRGLGKQGISAAVVDVGVEAAIIRFSRSQKIILCHIASLELMWYRLEGYFCPRASGYDDAQYHNALFCGVCDF